MESAGFAIAHFPLPSYRLNEEKRPACLSTINSALGDTSEILSQI